MSVETYLLCFHVFICASYLVIFSFFGKIFPSLFLLLCFSLISKKDKVQFPTLFILEVFLSGLDLEKDLSSNRIGTCEIADMSS